MATSASTNAHFSRPPRNEKSLPVKNTMAVSAEKPSSVTQAALAITPPPTDCSAIQSSGTKMTASASTNAPRAPYWAAFDSARAAALDANQLTTTNPPSTSNQLTLVIARAIGSAMPEVKKKTSMSANSRMAPRRCAYVRVRNAARASSPRAATGVR